MPEAVIGALWAFSWGVVAASGALAGAILGLTASLGHRAIAAFMSLAAGVLLSAASFKVASEALILAGAMLTIVGMLAGAATFSIANAALVKARDRKRCGECQPQPSEAEVPGSGSAITLGTSLDAVPEALVLGVTLRAGGPDLALVAALALANLPEALAGTAGMRRASRSSAYVLGLWGCTMLSTAATDSSCVPLRQRSRSSRNSSSQGLRSRSTHRHDLGNHDTGGIPQRPPVFRSPRCGGFRSSDISW